MDRNSATCDQGLPDADTIQDGQNYSGIAEYLDRKYLELMATTGREARGKLSAILTG